MPGPLIVGGVVVDLIQDIRGSVAMMMFILEEAIQTSMMTQWLATKHKLWDEAEEANAWIRQYLALQLKELSNAWWANAAYPLNHAYYTFAEATLRTLDIYRDLIHQGKKEQS